MPPWWCYRGGEFTSGGLDEIVERNAPYPEQEARAEFPLQDPCKLYAYGTGCGLTKL